MKSDKLNALMPACATRQPPMTTDQPQLDTGLSMALVDG